MSDALGYVLTKRLAEMNRPFASAAPGAWSTPSFACKPPAAKPLTVN